MPKFLNSMSPGKILAEAMSLMGEVFHRCGVALHAYRVVTNHLHLRASLCHAE
jgi:hypothetical protein